MAPIQLTPVAPGDVVRLRKPHPCGGHDWVVFRVGADIGLRCCTCHGRVMLTRREFERRLKAVVARAPQPTTTGHQEASAS
ncbi:MAG: DUF951 domain-containing protein [Anaerolineae bacterium]|nr:DUF951 domain-containing protein [Thermoflexales bacterium]MDW8395811.1 DUF951 domain-containing protein [Anaerolineae bacterium]